ncbi:hypothetical protein [Massilia sp.]|uniref:hypothetical protein n=1 Tax=Massilia sp. TaxID=1882437 RepID=UPI00352F3B1C
MDLEYIIRSSDILTVSDRQDILLSNAEYLNLKLDLYLIRFHNVLTVKRNGEKRMNIAKNMETVFLAAVVVAASISNTFAAPAAPLQVAARPVARTAPIAPAITIVIVGKRLTAAEKAKLAA